MGLLGGVVVTKRSLLASSALAGWALAYPATAAAQTPGQAVAASWTGFYAGIHGGYAWGANKTSCSFAVAALSPCDTFVFPGTRSKGGLFGGEVGANWQVQNWVFGLAGDFNWLDVSDTTQFPSIDAGKTDQFASRYDWLGTARGRVGFAAGRSLFYATGGAAFGRVKHEYVHNLFSQPPGGPGQTFAVAHTRTGWTVGAGWEFMLMPNWTFKAEYLHVDLGESNLDLAGLISGATAGGAPPGTSVLHFTNRLDIIRAGINFKF
jgi:outer membrane immunogenic protein